MDTQERTELVRLIRDAETEKEAITIFDCYLPAVEATAERLNLLKEENTALRHFISDQQMLKPDGVTDIHEMIDSSIKRAVEEGRTTTKNRSIGKRKQKTL